MFLEKLTLTNYRNYQTLDLFFDHKVNVVIGENAQGKTNLMESIYVLALTRSHRTPRDRELIKWDEEYAKIKGSTWKRNRSFPLEIIISKKGKKAKLNHLEQKRLSDYIGALNVVMFAPEDLNLVKGSPQERRRFIDMEIGQIQPSYVYHSVHYHRLLKQRNALLKELQKSPGSDRTMLKVLTDQMIQHGSEIVIRRYEFLQLLRKWARPIHEGISRGLEDLNITYDSSTNVSEDSELSKIVNVYQDHFKDIETKEVERGTTLIGPHRDDLNFFVNGKDVQTYGSQGQQRTTALSLKLAEIELIFNEVGEYPILLLDDVLSELDDYRQSHLLSTIQDKVQTFVSTTSVDGIDHEILNRADLFHVQKGCVTRER